MPPQATTSCGRPEVRFVRFYKGANRTGKPRTGCPLADVWPPPALGPTPWFAGNVVLAPAAAGRHSPIRMPAARKSAQRCPALEQNTMAVLEHRRLAREGQPPYSRRADFIDQARRASRHTLGVRLSDRLDRRNRVLAEAHLVDEALEEASAVLVTDCA